MNLVGYTSSKAALNGLTLTFSKALKDENISVNSVCPGWCKTDMGGWTRTAEQGVKIVLKLIQDTEFITGKFVDENGEIKW